MITHSESANPSIQRPDHSTYFLKLRVFLFYVPSTALILFFLMVNAYVLGETSNWNSTEDRLLRFQSIPSNDVLVGTLLALALSAINISYLVFTTIMVVRAFKRNIWLDEEKMDRFWFTFVLSFVAFLFIGGWTFFSWFNIDLASLE